MRRLGIEAESESSGFRMFECGGNFVRCSFDPQLEKGCVMSVLLKT